MLATLLCAVVTQQPQQPNLYITIVKQPTGQNGYEEYLQAADMAISGRLRSYVSPVRELSDQETRLDKLREAARNVSRIQTLIERGNRKSVSYPNSMKYDTAVNELSYFTTIGRALVYKAEVHFADGQVNEGFSTLMAVVEFGDKLSGSGLIIHNVVGRSLNTHALRLLAESTALTSVPAADNIHRRITALLSAPSPWIKSLATELETVVDNARAMMYMYSKSTGEIDETFKEMGALSEEQKEQVLEELHFAALRSYDAHVQMFDQPEREWPQIIKQIAVRAGPKSTYARVLFDTWLPDIGRADIREIVRRTQFRLLIVYSAVAKFKWDYGYYPGSLTQLEDQSIVVDPLTGDQFEYERTDSSFRLYSNGLEDTGLINLKYSPSRQTVIKPD